MNTKDNYQVIISTASAFLGGASYWGYAVLLNRDGIMGVNTIGNFKTYALLLLLFTFFFLLTAGIYSIIKRKIFRRNDEQIIDKTIGKPRLIILLILGGLFVVCSGIPYFDDISSFPEWMNALIILLITFFVFAYIYCSDTQIWNNRFLLLATILLIVMCSSIWGYASATSNIFVRTGSGDFGSYYNLYHASAYIDTIYNVYYKIPYMEGMQFTDLYGHYGLIFYPFLKIFGGNIHTISIILGILNAGSAAFVFLAACIALKSNFTRAAAIIVTTAFGVSAPFMNIYWQVFPHRIIFPAAFIFLITYYWRYGLKTRGYIIGTICLILNMIWNNETAIICGVAWTVFLVAENIYNNGFSIKNFIKIFAIIVCMWIVVITVPLTVVNIYNHMCNGSIIRITDYLGPVNVDFMKNRSSELDFFNKEYVFKLFAFLLGFAVSFGNMLFQREGKKRTELGFLFSNSVIALGLMTYYINRTKAGNDLTDMYYICCLSGYLDIMYQRKNLWKNPQKKQLYLKDVFIILLGSFSILMLTVSCFYGIEKYPICLSKNGTGAYDYKSFQDYTKAIYSSIDENTWSAGLGSSAVFFEFDKDKQSYEWNYVDEDELKKHDNILLLNVYYDKIPENYTLKCEFPYEELVFGYFEKNE